jgi:hypothetical protein
MHPNSHMPPPEIDRGQFFTCLVTGDLRLPEAAFPFVCETLGVDIRVDVGLISRALGQIDVGPATFAGWVKAARSAAVSAASIAALGEL